MSTEVPSPADPARSTDQAHEPRAGIGRRVSAVPDAATALFFLLLWCAPHWLPAYALETALAVMAVEFVLLHATVMLGSSVVSVEAGARRPWGRLVGLSLAYLLFVVVWSWLFQAMWPLIAFAWLLLSKLRLLFQPGPSQTRRQRMYSDWGIASMAYFGACIATAFLPVPGLGLAPDVVAAARLEGGGLWVEQSQTVVAAGALCFSLVSLSRLLGWRLPGR